MTEYFRYNLLPLRSKQNRDSWTGTVLGFTRSNHTHQAQLNRVQDLKLCKWPHTYLKKSQISWDRAIHDKTRQYFVSITETLHEIGGYTKILCLLMLFDQKWEAAWKYTPMKETEGSLNREDWADHRKEQCNEARREQKHLSNGLYGE